MAKINPKLKISSTSTIRKKEMIPKGRAGAYLDKLGIEQGAIKPMKRVKLTETVLDTLSKRDMLTQGQLAEFLAKLPANERKQVREILNGRRAAEAKVATKYLAELGIDPAQYPEPVRLKVLKRELNRLFEMNVSDMLKAKRIADEAERSMMKSGYFGKRYFE